MLAGQGLQLAQAAAALSGKDPGVLDRLRGGLGLDWLRWDKGRPGRRAVSSIRALSRRRHRARPHSAPENILLPGSRSGSPKAYRPRPAKSRSKSISATTSRSIPKPARMAAQASASITISIIEEPVGQCWVTEYVPAQATASVSINACWRPNYAQGLSRTCAGPQSSWH